MIVSDAFANRRVAVLGWGASGQAAARSLREGGAEVAVWDDAPAALQEAEAEGWPSADNAWLETAALLAVSPGVPHLYPRPHPLVEQAWRLGVPVDNDIGLLAAWLEGRGIRLIGVTGCNGKSTACALLARVLQKAGMRAEVAGNIGYPVLDIEPPDRGDALVLELSSYQLDLVSRLELEVGVFLNFADDHLDRHGGRGGYFAAKARIAEAAAAVAVGLDSSEGLRLHSRMLTLGRKVAGVGDGPPAAVVVGEDALVLVEDAGGGRIALPELPGFADSGGRRNAGCVAAAALALGLDCAQIERGMEGFAGLPHRLEWLGRAGGVDVVNDSKATNAAAAARALSSARRIRWIAGGRAKEGGIEGLADQLASVSKAYLIGEAAAEFARAMPGVEHEISGGLDAAVAHALAEAQPGETVMLSPACASYDQYRNFEERGDHFRDLVAPHLTEARA